MKVGVTVASTMIRTAANSGLTKGRRVHTHTLVRSGILANQPRPSSLVSFGKNCLSVRRVSSQLSPNTTGDGIVEVRTKEGVEVREQDIKRISAELYFGPDSNSNELEVKQVTGGITNFIFKISDPKTNKSVLMRVFGEGSNLFIDRTQEEKYLKEMTSLGFGLRLEATFSNGRLEEFFEARTLGPEDLKNFQINSQIATKLAEMHSLPMTPEAVNTNGGPKPILWDRLLSWVELSKKCSFLDPVQRKKFNALNMSQVEKEIHALKRLLDATPSPIVFSHNDCLPGNIMLNANGRLELIDMEYGGYNFRGFDIGNHFCEYAGFDYDKILDMYPNKGQQYFFFDAYLRASGIKVIRDYQLDSMYEEVNRYALASHLFWGLWAVVQAKHSAVDFDYLNYAQQRIGSYYMFKEKFMPTTSKL